MSQAGPRSLSHATQRKQGDFPTIQIQGRGPRGRAEKDKEGPVRTHIPSSDELRGLAKNTKNTFLAATLKQARGFREIEPREGSERAVDGDKGGRGDLSRGDQHVAVT